jgi:hypothetical protein
MIDFKNRDDVLPSALILLSLVILAGTVIFMLLVPAPTTTGMKRLQNRQQAKVRRQTEKLTAEAAQSQTDAQKWLWKGDAQAVTSAALAQMTTTTQKYGVGLTSFRPQRAQQLPGVTEMRYNAQVTGPFTKVSDVMAALDATGSKLLLTSVDVAQSGSNNGSVTATLGVSAYMPASVNAGDQTGDDNAQS